ncbi:Abi family protein [Fusobacterium periodonticum]|uniref:Abi family protein n=1 Tax=Fusobacterium periodonticum TaxID=860 RepID=UPI0028D2DB8F|nr:Abi family protein [Fusobacterium periodonticum]
MENESFKNKVNLPTIFLFSLIDKRFQNILFLYSVYVETIFKTKMAYIISKNKGIENVDYLDFNKYTIQNPKRKNRLIKTLNDITAVHLYSEDNPTKHYREKHNHIPPWILFKNVKFRTMIDLFTFLNRNEKLELIQEYDIFKTNKITEDEKLEMFKNMISIIRKFRNKIAHNSKVIGISILNNSLNFSNLLKIDIFKLIKKKDIKHQINNTVLFSMFVSLVYLLSPNIIHLLFTNDVINFLASGEKELIRFYLEKANFPMSIENRLNDLKKKLELKLDLE